ncbi:hypothetical protein HS088_TW04G01048 [Tripterygium wilfordii]|uniref:Pentatricopeptide repeat-containing protein n=1 Tax=Tripterygium wilfordii TaxID=458696 RepID=A0A7J7DSH9_TRIWF|nr:pentatricopeptide repeat-containing protein At3g26540 [Tripterygium wilfordii]XP_038698824.1 pentatricopeptide repeat-containing protein At3g26540 [Tripterygium wilfordii]KAF5749086.1 hypothetical protein HS088_TW04G01048 [Tripterygium wilfordii]
MAVNAASILNRLGSNKSSKRGIQPTTVNSLTKTILSHISAGRLQKAVSVLFASPFPVPHSLYAHLFQLCSSNHAIVDARKVESHLVTHDPIPPVFLLNRAIETYGKCGCLEDARQMFEEMPHRDGGSWNAIVTAYTQGGCAEEALSMFLKMNKSGIFANEVTFASVLGSCGMLLDLWLARQVHVHILKYGFCGNVILRTSLVDVYGKRGVMSDARRMFDEIENPNSVSWNVIVRRYFEMDEGKEAIFMFSKMFGTDVKPMNSTFSTALVACSNMFALKEGIQIHGLAIKINFDEEEVVSSSLINMYVKCGKLEEARRIFDQPDCRNVISGTSVLLGYAMSGRTREARQFFDEMPEKNVITWNAMLEGYMHVLQWEEALDFVLLMLKKSKEIDHVTLRLILNVCAGVLDVEMGKQIHGFVYRHGFYFDTYIGNALIDMYGKCGNLRSARCWFYQMSQWRDKVSWNSLLTSYARHGLSEQAMTIFSEMQWEAKPSKYTFATLLAACANIFAFEQGKQIHGFMTRNGYEIDIVVVGALVDMYSKCRCLDYAIKIFKQADTRDVVLWNSMVFGCCHSGRGRDVLELFELMEKDRIKPDHLTFHAILLACIYEGDVELGRLYFDSMSSVYHIIPRLEHYECIIELYSRYGRINELESFVEGMPFEPTVPMLTRVFDACKEFGHSRLGEWAATRLMG